jgi:hypothetical protein
MNKKIQNNHQILYAKNFYRHSGDIIDDMKVICKLDCPNQDFYSPKFILKFMREQFNAWLDATPEVKKERGSKVAWENDPIKAEIWSILIAYSVYIPMTSIGGYIKELPNYNVMPPQYNVKMSSIMSNVFNKSMSVEQLTEKAKEVLNMPMLEIMDKLADNLVSKYNFKKSSAILEKYGIKITPEDLDNELWDGYSDLMNAHIKEVDGAEVVEEGSFTRITDHFIISIDTRNNPNNTNEITVDLCPIKWEITGDDVITETNYREEFCELASKVSAIAKGDAEYIACSTKDIDDVWTEVPEHVKDAIEVEDAIEHSPKIYLDYWESDGDEFRCFAQHTGDNPRMSGSGCFDTYIFNVDGKMRIILAHTTTFDCDCFEHELRNCGSCFINDKME